MAKLRLNDRGPAVFLLQMRLNELGFDPSGIDGVFGPGTRRAVSAFQQARHLPATGIVDDACIRALDFHPDAEISSGYDGVSINTVARMFAPVTPLANIHQHLPNVLEALLHDRLTDRGMLLMALASIRAETERFEPISEHVSKHNTSKNGHPFDLYDDREKLGNQGPPDGERFRGRGFIQLTGRKNYTQYGPKVGVDLIADPGLANDSLIAARLLAAFLKDQESEIRCALEKDDLKEARRLVNGGSHGLEPFTMAYRAGEELIALDFQLRRSAAAKASVRPKKKSARHKESTMTKIGPRTYTVTRHDYPITVNIQAQQVEVFQGVVSEALVTRDGSEITRFPLELAQPGEDPQFRAFTIPVPDADGTPGKARYEAPASIHLTFHGFFSTAISEQPRYGVTITSAGGNEETTSVRRPTVEPGVAHITFQYQGA